MYEIKKEDAKNIAESAKINYEKSKTRKLSIKEGSISAVSSSFGSSYITPFALAIGANNLQIGFLSSLLGLLSPLFQLLGLNYMEKYARKKIITTSVLFQSLMWLPIMLIAFLFWKGILTGILPWIIIIFFTLLSIFGSVAVPAWFSLIGDSVEEKQRGDYFSHRNKTIGIFALFATIISAFLLDYFKTRGLLLLGFAIFFLIACLLRLKTVPLLKKHYDNEKIAKPQDYFSFLDFLKKLPKTNFGRFVIFVSVMYFAVMVASPFFTVHMLNELKFSYTTYMLVSLSSSIAALLILPVWGKLSDKYGNIKILKIASFLIPLVPFLWIFSPSPYYLAFIPQIISGIGWSGFDLAATNFIYDSVSQRHRGICFTYYNILLGIGTFLGAAIGGFLAQYLTIKSISIFMVIFAISGILRLIVSLAFTPFLKEVRPVQRSGLMSNMSLKLIKPVSGMMHEWHILHNPLDNTIRKIEKKGS